PRQPGATVPDVCSRSLTSSRRTRRRATSAASARPALRWGGWRWLAEILTKTRQPPPSDHPVAGSAVPDAHEARRQADRSQRRAGRLPDRGIVMAEAEKIALVIELSGDDGPEPKPRAIERPAGRDSLDRSPGPALCQRQQCPRERSTHRGLASQRRHRLTAQ